MAGTINKNQGGTLPESETVSSFNRNNLFGSYNSYKIKAA